MMKYAARRAGEETGGAYGNNGSDRRNGRGYSVRSGKGQGRSYGQASASGRYEKKNYGEKTYGAPSHKKAYVQPDSGYGRDGRKASFDGAGKAAYAKPQRSSFERGAKSFDRGDAPAKRPQRQHEEGYENPNLVIGRNPVTEAIKSGRPIDKILMQKDGEGSVRVIAGLAREQGLQLQYVDKIVLDKLCPGKSHQGVAAYVAAHEYVSVDDILAAAAKKNEDPFIIILDGLEDPHNLGAILRTADGAGAHGVIIPSRRSVSLTDTVAKASAGAIEYVPVAKVNNLAQTIDELKKKGIWIASVDMGGVNYPDAGLKGPLAIVIGSEGDGISRLVREKSDFIVGIPMKGRVNSLNASNAAAIVMYEAARQRELGK